MMRFWGRILIVAAVVTIAWGVVTWQERQSYYAVFPKLQRIEVYDPPERNCIAWSVGDFGWLWPDGGSLEDFDRFNARYGFRRLDDLDWSYQPGTQKLLTYGSINSEGQLVVTHQARQMPDGSWTSKLGKRMLIRHEPEELSGERYGEPVAVYVR